MSEKSAGDLADRLAVGRGRLGGDVGALRLGLDVGGEAVEAVAAGRLVVDDRHGPLHVTCHRLAEPGEVPAEHQQPGPVRRRQQLVHERPAVEAVPVGADPQVEVGEPYRLGLGHDGLDVAPLGLSVLPDPHALALGHGQDGPGRRRRQHRRRRDTGKVDAGQERRLAHVAVGGGQPQDDHHDGAPHPQVRGRRIVPTRSFRSRGRRRREGGRVRPWCDACVEHVPLSAPRLGLRPSRIPWRPSPAQPSLNNSSSARGRPILPRSAEIATEGVLPATPRLPATARPA